MIHKLLLVNFQSHAYTELSFHEGVNVIVGSSDSGKSSIIRALHWIVRNRPSGSSYRSSWGGQTKCLLEAPEGVLGHFRGDTETGYTINDAVLRAVGTEVPEEVSALVRMDDLNIQYQHDAPFGISFTAGEMAKLLNRIVKLDAIDTTLSNIDSMKRKEKIEEQQLRDLLKRKKEEGEKYNALPSMENDLILLEEQEKKIEEQERNKENLLPLLSEIFSCVNKLINFPNIEGEEKDIEGLQRKTEEIKEKEEKGKKILSLLEAIYLARDYIKRSGALLEEYEEEFKKKIGKICPLCGQAIQ